MSAELKLPKNPLSIGDVSDSTGVGWAWVARRGYGS